MTRVRKPGVELSVELDMALVLGPGPLTDDLSFEDLAIGWLIHGDSIMEGQRQDGGRPWGWWTFEQGEEPPPQEPGASEIRLAELGELTEEECAALAEWAAEARVKIETGQQHYIATGGGRIDYEREAIDRWERVQVALRRPHPAA